MPNNNKSLSLLDSVNIKQAILFFTSFLFEDILIYF